MILAMLFAGQTFTVFAADTATGIGNGVAQGSGSVSSNATDTAVGKNAQAKGGGSLSLGSGSRASNEGSVAVGRGSVSTGKSSIAIGDNAQVQPNMYAFTGIAIGKGAYVLSGTGQQEYEFSFNKESWNGKDNLKNVDDALNRLPGGIAIGTNSYARTGSVEIGSHTMQGKTMAGTTVENTSANIIDMTTIGTNSYNKGMMATIVGAYSINTGNFTGGGGLNSLLYGSQNMGSVLVGSLNQNRSKGYGGYSGIANTIVGIANTAENANGTLIYGAGNKITNAYGNISFSGNYGADTVDELQDKLTNTVKASGAGGGILAFGGGNTADYAKHSQIIGVNNTIKGTSDDPSEYNMIDGFNVTATKVDNVSVIGAADTVEFSKGIQLFGDNRNLSNVQNSVILGSAESETSLTASQATLLGYNTNVQADGGVALGAGSILNDSESGLDMSGYDPATGTNATSTTSVWRPTLAAVSIGANGTATRRITNVAAGVNDTDAVNVAQLKLVAGTAGGSTNLIAGDGIKLSQGDDGSWTISTNFENSGSDEVTYKEGTASSGTDGTTSGNAAVIETKLKADDGNTTSLGSGSSLGIKGDGTNIATTVSGSDVKVALSKDIEVNSVTINNGPTVYNGGIDMNNTKITNVQDGDISQGSKDAVNGGQLWDVQQGMSNRISRLDTKIDRVGAGAAALANLHPLDFDPDDKWSFSAAFGNYRSANAMAVGAFYRPDEKSMVNVSGSFGNGENMIGIGASFKLGKESPVTRGNLQKTITNLQTLVASQDAKIEAQNKQIARLEKLVSQLINK